MEQNISKLIALAGNQNRYQYLLTIMCFLSWFNFNVLGFVLPFLENQPLVSYFDKEENETIVESLSYDICKWEKSNYTVVETYKYSWIIQLGIECNKAKVSLIGTLVSVGMLLGAVLYSYIKRLLGQKKGLIISNIAFMVIFILMIFIDNYPFLCVGCVLSLIFCNVTSYSIMVLFSELIAKNRKGFFSACINSGLGLGGFFYVCMFWAIQNWKYVFVIVLGVCAVLLILQFFLLFDSLSTYSQKGDIDGLLKALTFIARFNGREKIFKENLQKEEYKNIIEQLRGGISALPINTPKSDRLDDKNMQMAEIKQTESDEIEKDRQLITLNSNHDKSEPRKNSTGENFDIKKKETKETQITPHPSTISNNNDKKPGENINKPSGNKKEIKLSPFILLKYPSIRYTFILFCILWFFGNSLYTGLTIGVKSLPGTIYVNSLLLFAAETPGYFISGITMNNPKLGRKYSLMMYTGLFGLCNVLLYVFYNYKTLSIVIYLITRFFVVCSFIIYYTYALESYPLSVAQLAYGINGAFNSLGGIVVPFVIEYIETRTLYLCYGIIGFICVLLMLFLKETFGKLPREEIKEIEEQNKNNISVVIV